MPKYYQCDCGIVANEAEAYVNGTICPSCKKDMKLVTDKDCEGNGLNKKLVDTWNKEFPENKVNSIDELKVNID